MTAHRPSPELLDRLAAEYVLGTLKGGARRRFERELQIDTALQRRVLQWQQRLLPLDAGVPPAAAGDALWARIEQQAFAGGSAATPRTLPWWQRLFAPIPAGALALGLLLGAVGPTLWPLLGGQAALDTQLPESYVGVLATADGRPGLIVSSLRRGQVVDVKRVAAVPVPPGQVLMLWSLDAQGVAQAIGALPQGAFVSVPLAQPAEALFQRAVELAVSLEPDGTGALPAAPSSAYVYRGLCGKLWVVPPGPPTPAAASTPR